jgi:transcriptional regulator with XRE-family HTH domain
LPRPLFTRSQKNQEEAKEAISGLIREFLEREDRGIGWLAERINVHRTTVSRILHKRVLADPTTCRALAEVIGMPPDKVLSLAGYLPSEEDTPQIEDPELGFYLSQIGKMPEKTREIVKTILREEYRQLQDRRFDGKEGQTARPPFARTPKTK